MKKREWNIISVDECDSTSSEIKLLRAQGMLPDRTALMTKFQLSGKGQGENQWHSSRNNNLLVSLYLKTGIDASKNFFLTIITSLALYRLLKKYKVDCKIKWPNDIYYSENKIAGVLIENSLMRNVISNSIIGVGLNINELKFPDWLPNPCSIKQITKETFNPESICIELLNEIDVLFDEFEKDSGMELYHQYTSLLFRMRHWHLYKKDGIIFNGQIHGVEPDGRLILETEGGKLLSFMFGEIEYVI